MTIFAGYYDIGNRQSERLQLVIFNCAMHFKGQSEEKSDKSSD